MTSEKTPHLELVVLTGDIVGSSRLAPTELDSAFRALELAAFDITRDWGHGHARFTRFRGDGWQSSGIAPNFSLRAALILRARLRRLGRSFDTRISIGIGQGQLAPDALDLNAASGPAFELSGRGLDKMAHAPRFAIAWQTPPDAAVFIQSIFALCDEISRHWTPRQAEVFAHMLGPARRPNQESLALLLDIKQQVVARHLVAGGDWALRQALDTLEASA